MNSATRPVSAARRCARVQRLFCARPATAGDVTTPAILRSPHHRAGGRGQCCSPFANSPHGCRRSTGAPNLPGRGYLLNMLTSTPVSQAGAQLGGRPPTSRATGMALVAALFVLLTFTMIALGVARVAFDADRSARAERDRQLAFQAAEAGLADAERDIEGGANPASSRAALFHDDSASGFVAGCGQDASNLGLCAYSLGAVPAWQLVETGASVPYGSYTGATVPAFSYDGPLPLRPPRYVIERLPAVRAGEDAGAGHAYVYRVTAFGYGALADTLVVLQSVYRGSAVGAP